MADERLTIQDILRMSIEERKNSRFNATANERNIGVVKIDNNEFTNYGTFSFLWEKSYVKSPQRSGDGSIDNLNSYASFLTPHLKINFTMMSIDDYRRIMELIYSKNEFLVECYDVVYNKMTTQKMYFTTEEMPKLWTIARALNGEEWVELLGVEDYTVELVGTNADLKTVDILYYDMNGVLIPEATQQAVVGTDIIIGFNYMPPAPYRFDGFWRTELYGKRRNGDALLINGELKLYAEVSNENQYTLSFNYGKGVEPIQSVNAQPVINVAIQVGETIATAISRANIQTTNGLFTFPENGTGLSEIKYKLGEEEYTVNGNRVYEFKGWYWTSEENAETKVTGATAFNYETNRTIYQIYNAIPHTLNYVTNTNQILLEAQSLGYGEKIVLPSLALNGYTFKGWFLDQEQTIAAPKTMPPIAITVYAGWEKIE